MKAFIAISQITRKQYIATLPFIYAMCKLPIREDIQNRLQKYIDYKTGLA